MTNNFDTIREALRLLLPDYPETAITAIDALAAIEAAMSSASAQGHRDGVASVQGEPFGYFRPEPFGWTDCAETDDGAIALYATPVAQQQADAQDKAFRDGVASVTVEQEPVAWAVYWGLPPTRKNSVHFDKESAQAVANQIKSATEVRPLYAAPVAQQPQCWCTTCRPQTVSDMRFVVCPDCGNKRCPRAHNHALACTDSNEPGQPGSSWEHVKPAPQPQTEVRTDDFGAPIVYDTDAIDELTHALTGDEGEDDSVTVLRRLVRYLNVVYPGKTMTQVLEEAEDALQQPQAEAVPNTLQKAEAHLLNLIGEYWGLAYAEGAEGRTHDTEDGAAQRTHAAIAKAVKDLIAAASSTPQQAEAVPPKRATGWAAPKDRYTTPVLFNPYTGGPRDVRDVLSDPQGILIVPPGALMLAAKKEKS